MDMNTILAYSYIILFQLHTRLFYTYDMQPMTYVKLWQYGVPFEWVGYFRWYGTVINSSYETEDIYCIKRLIF